MDGTCNDTLPPPEDYGHLFVYSAIATTLVLLPIILCGLCLWKKAALGRQIITSREAMAKLNKLIKEKVNWLMDSPQEQRERLKNFLLKIDELYRVDPDSERSKNIHQGVMEIMETIGRMITERKPELGGRIVPLGSAHNGTKIGDSDEFDFVYEIKLDALLKGKGTFIGYYKDVDYVLVCIEDSSDREFFTRVDNDSKYPNGCWRLNPVLVNRFFRMILEMVLSELTFPPGWGHGGFNGPEFSGMRFQGRSNLLQFDNLDLEVRLSVDFVPMIKLPMDKIKLPTLDLELHRRYLLREISPEYCWWSIYGHSSKQIFFGHVEEEWLSTFSNESTPKILIRICKVLNKLVEMYSPIFPPERDVRDILRHRTQLPITVEKRTAFLYDANDYVSFSDLNETIGDLCMLKSYDIKTVVMAIMAQDESQARTWTGDDLLELVISVYMILLDVIKHDTSHSSRISHFCKITKLVVHLNEAHGQMENKIKTTPQVEHNVHRAMGELLEETETTDVPSIHQEIDPYLLKGKRSVHDIIQMLPGDGKPSEPNRAEVFPTESEQPEPRRMEMFPFDGKPSEPHRVETFPTESEQQVPHGIEMFPVDVKTSEPGRVETIHIESEQQVPHRMEMFPVESNPSEPHRAEKFIVESEQTALDRIGMIFAEVQLLLRGGLGMLDADAEEPKLKFYTSTKALLQEMDIEVFEMLPIIQSRIYAIFQILRSVCEGYDSVTIRTMSRLKLEDNTGSTVARKAVLKELLQTLKRT